MLLKCFQITHKNVSFPSLKIASKKHPLPWILPNEIKCWKARSGNNFWRIRPMKPCFFYCMVGSDISTAQIPQLWQGFDNKTDVLNFSTSEFILAKKWCINWKNILNSFLENWPGTKEQIPYYLKRLAKSKNYFFRVYVHIPSG